MTSTNYLEAGYFQSLDAYLNEYYSQPEEADDYNFILTDGIEFDLVPSSNNQVYVMYGNCAKLKELEKQLEKHFINVVPDVENAFLDDDGKSDSLFTVRFEKPIPLSTAEDLLFQTYNYIAFCAHTHEEPLSELAF